jgi:hypothetical protein
MGRLDARHEARGNVVLVGDAEMVRRRLEERSCRVGSRGFVEEVLSRNHELGVVRRHPPQLHRTIVLSRAPSGAIH